MSSHRRRSWWLAAYGLLLMTIASTASANLSGAIYTTLGDGTQVNQNTFPSRESVYLNGGPQNDTGSGLPPGQYYFQVTDPSGGTLLSVDSIRNRRVLVGANGRVAGSLADPADPLTYPGHANGSLNPANGSIPVQLFEFNNTPNVGGEYKVWITPVGEYVAADGNNPKKKFGFSGDTKSDNFKIEPATPLSIQCPSDIEDCLTGMEETKTVSYSVAVSGGVNPILTVTPPSPAAFTAGSHTVVATVSDAAGQTVSCSFTVTILPAGQCTPQEELKIKCPGDQELCADDQCVATGVTFAAATVTGGNNPHPVVYTAVLPGNPTPIAVSPGDAFGPLPKGTTVITAEVEDDDGNTASCSFEIVVKDCDAPDFTVEDHDFGCVKANPGIGILPGVDDVRAAVALTATDNCSSGEGITINVTQQADVVDGCNVSRSFIVSAADESGNTTSEKTVTFTVKVLDKDPTFDNAPGDDTLQCHADLKAAPAVTGTDACGATLTAVLEESGDNGTSCKNTITRMWTLTDCAGNTATHTQTITINDDTPPVITCPASPGTVNLGAGKCTANVTWSAATATDNCGGTPTVVQIDGPLPGSDLEPGTYTVVYKATDDCGNPNTCSFEFKVNGRLTLTKYYDPKFDNSGATLIPGWKFRVVGTGYDQIITAPTGTISINVPAGDYTVTEVMPSNYINTSPQTVQASSTTCGSATFWNVCLGAGGGHTLGFWSNKNGEAAMNDGGSNASELALLVGLNLRNANGTAFDPANYSSFRSWLLNATATNMSYMLSAQLAAMALNVEAGYVNGSALIYAPGTNSANALGLATVNAVMAEANALLGTNGTILSGSPLRSRAEAVKNALDKANNNLNFVQSSVCPPNY